MKNKQQLEFLRSFTNDKSKNIVFYDPKYEKGNCNMVVGGIKGRFFTLEEFDETKAQGYIKLIQTEKGLGIKVIDTYNNESKEEEEKYINSGYIKVGYPPR
ncbi:hypothetical protein OHM08_002564 [Enterococcus faecium]|nr:hypothetical protein [Enterococcus faecium]